MVGLTIGTETMPGGAVGAPGLAGAGGFDGGLAQAASNPKIELATALAAANPRRGAARFPDRRAFDMWVILLEAFGAALLLILIVWWTMFAGRKRGERRDE